MSNVMYVFVLRQMWMIYTHFICKWCKWNETKGKEEKQLKNMYGQCECYSGVIFVHPENGNRLE